MVALTSLIGQQSELRLIEILHFCDNEKSDQTLYKKVNRM